MRIVLLTRRLIAAGAERQVLVAAKGLRDRGHDVAVVLFYRGGVLEERLRESGVPLHHLGKRGRWDFVGPLMSLVRFVRSHRSDVVYSFLPGDNLATLPLKLLVPRTRLVWGVHSADRTKSAHGVFSRALHVLEASLSFVPRAIVVPSEESRRHAIARGTSARRLQIVPNAVDVEEFVPSPDAALAFRRELEVSESTPLIGIVGRIASVKDHPLFLRAAVEISSHRPDVRFVITGMGAEDDVKKLQALASQMGIASLILWTGERKDLPAVYSALDVLVLCSLSEAFGNVLAEAMACGTPCVATDVGSATEVIGNTGVVIRGRDPAELAAACERLLGMKERVAPFAREQIASMYSASTAALKLEAVLAG